MTSSVVVYESPDQVRKDLAALKAQVEDVLPGRVDPERFLRVIAKAVIESPKLMACTRLSLLAAVHESAQLGLEPSGLLGSAYLVPYRMRREVNGQWKTVSEAKLIVGYRGLIELAHRSGEIQSIQAELVRLNDAFDYQPPRRPDPVRHVPFIPNPTLPIEERDRGPVVGVYMLATLRTGFVHPEWMTYDEVEAVRKSSKAADDGPWVTHWAQMARKTVVRRGSNYLPLTTEFRRALELDDEAEREAVAVVAASAPVNKATQMLLDRAQTRSDAPGGEAQGETSSSTPDEQNGAPGASTEQSSGTSAPQKPAKTSKRAPKASTGEACAGTSDELGQCGKPAGHDGPHKNDAGVWPQAVEAQAD